MSKRVFIKAQQIKLLALFCCAFFTIKAQQNIILNGNMEDTNYCNITGFNITQLKHWYNPTNNSSYAEHYCVYNNPGKYGSRSGFGCSGGYTYITNSNPDGFMYIANKFSDTLKIGQKYCFNLYLKLTYQFRHGSNNLGIFIENTNIYYPTFSLVPSLPVAVLPNTITDTIYQKFNFLYSAMGNETDFMIGGYMPYTIANYPLLYPTHQADGSFFVYDDFSMVPTEIDLGPDTTLCAESDSILMGEPNWVETKYKWYANGILIDTIHGQLKVKPNSTTTYIVQKETSCITTFDTLLVTYTGACPILPTDIKEPVIPNVFSPNGDDVNESWRITLPNGAKLNNLEVYNRWGNIVFTSEGTIKPWFGRTSSGEACSEGVYFFVLRYTDTKGEEQKKNGYISLFR